jgi:transposase
VSIREQIESLESVTDPSLNLLNPLPFYPPHRFGDDMWTTENRARYDRSRLRYPSGDDEWSWIRPLIPPARPGGNKRTVVERDLMNGLMYVLSTGCQWAALPRDLPPRSTVNDYFRRWTDDGTLDRLHHALYAECRDLAERKASPSAAIIDSQSVKKRGKGRGFD